MMRRPLLVLVCLLSVLSAGLAANLQTVTQTGPPPPSGTSAPNPLRPDPSVSAPTHDKYGTGYSGPIPNDVLYKMAVERNKQRVESLKKDTEKLFLLASEIKEAVNKSGEGAISLDVIRKSEEMEKLAKQVRKRMRDE